MYMLFNLKHKIINNSELTRVYQPWSSASSDRGRRFKGSCSSPDIFKSVRNTNNSVQSPAVRTLQHEVIPCSLTLIVQRFIVLIREQLCVLWQKHEFSTSVRKCHKVYFQMWRYTRQYLWGLWEVMTSEWPRIDFWHLCRPLNSQKYFSNVQIMQCFCNVYPMWCS